MGHDYELSDYDRSDLIFTKEMLLAEPLSARPCRKMKASQAVSSILFFLAAIGVISGADRRGRAAQPLLQRARARHPSGLAGRPVPAAAGGVRGGRAGRRLCGRGDGALRVRRRLRRRRGAIRSASACAAEPPARACASAARSSAGRCASSCLIALLGTGLEAIGGYGAGYSPGPQTYGTPAYIGKLLLTRFLLAFEVASFLLLIAAVGGGRARPPPRRPGRARTSATCSRRLTCCAPAARARWPRAWDGAAREHRLVSGGLGDRLLARRRRRHDPAQPARRAAVPRADAQRRQPRADRLLAHVGQRRRADPRASS